MLFKFKRDDCGATAVEFALVAGPFFLLLIASIELSLKTLVQTQLDNQLYDFAMTLSREDDAGVSKAEYKTNVICGSSKSPLLDCAAIKMGADAFPNNVRFFPIRNNIFADEWNTGCAGSTVIVELLYPITHILVPFAVADVVSYEGDPHFRSRGVIRREPLLSGTGTHSGGTPC